MTKLLALVVLVLALWLIAKRARAAFLASARGQELSAVWHLVRQVARATAPSAGPASAATTPHTAARGARPAAPSNLLVRCSACGTHVPEGSARRRGTGVFCSVACEQRAAS